MAAPTAISKAELVEKYVGKTLKDPTVSLPAAVLDLAAIKRNCDRMTDAVPILGDVRIAVSSHKTTEITRLHIGEPTTDLIVRLIVETLSEAENLLPTIIEYLQKGVQVNVLYASPIAVSKVDRLADFNSALVTAGGSLSVLIDHCAQLPTLQQLFEKSGHPSYVYINLDSGDGVSGLSAKDTQFAPLLSELEQMAFREGPITLEFVGFYSRQTYIEMAYKPYNVLALITYQLYQASRASQLQHLRLCISSSPILPNLGAFLEDNHTHDRNLNRLVRGHIAMMETILRANHSIEITTDLQTSVDVKTLYKHTMGETEYLSFNDIPLTILTEVSSIYKDRGDHRNPQVLIDIGTSCLGQRDAANPQASLGLMSQWNIDSKPMPMHLQIGWQVVKVENDHAVLGWCGEKKKMQLLRYGQRIRVFPWDGQQAMDGFEWFLVVDSSLVGREDEIIDVFVRWRG